MRYRTLNNLLLVLTAFIWGCAFVAQSVGMDYVGPFTFNAARSILGGIALLPVIYVMNRGKKRDALPDENTVKNAVGKNTVEKRQERKTLLLGGICCGAALAVASSLQQIGIMYTSAGKAGFITALYILIVPIIGIFLGKRAGKKVWTGVVLAVVGMYFLCINGGFSIAKGDFYVILCAVGFSVHILVIDYFSPKVDGVRMSCIQFFVSGILCGIPALIFEQPKIPEVLSAWMPILYAGVLSSGVGYTLQIVAQKKTDPTVASLLMSLESVFSVLAGWVILGERLSGRETFGCVLVFAAVILAQLPERRKV